MSKIYKNQNQEGQNLNQGTGQKNKRSMRMVDYLKSQSSESATTEEPQNQPITQNVPIQDQTLERSAREQETAINEQESQEVPSAIEAGKESEAADTDELAADTEEVTKESEAADTDELAADTEEVTKESEAADTDELAADTEEEASAGVEVAESEGLVLQGEFINKYLEAGKMPAQMSSINSDAWQKGVGLDGGVPAALKELASARSEFEAAQDYEGITQTLGGMKAAADKALQGISQVRSEVDNGKESEKAQALKQFEDNLKGLSQELEARQNALQGIYAEAQDYVQNPAVIRNKSVMSVFLQHGMQTGEGFSPYFRLIRAIEKKMEPEKIFYGCIINRKRAEGARNKGKEKAPRPDKIELPAKVMNLLWKQYLNQPEQMDFGMAFKYARTAVRRESLKKFLNDPATGLFHNKKLFEGLQNSSMPDFKKHLKTR